MSKDLKVGSPNYEIDLSVVSSLESSWLNANSTQELKHSTQGIIATEHVNHLIGTHTHTHTT